MVFHFYTATNIIWNKYCMIFKKVLQYLTAPRKATGDISVKYIGAIPALIPALTPMKKRPAINIS